MREPNYLNIIRALRTELSMVAANALHFTDEGESPTPQDILPNEEQLVGMIDALCEDGKFVQDIDFRGREIPEESAQKLADVIKERDISYTGPELPGIGTEYLPKKAAQIRERAGSATARSA